MTASELQKALLQEETEILADVQTINTAGENVTGVTGCEQSLPVVTENDEDESKFFPFFIVRLEDGQTADDDSPWVVDTNIIFGCHDANAETNGHRHIMTMIQRTIDRFASEPLLDGAFRAGQDMTWVLQEEDNYPFFYGSVQIKFSIPKIGRSVPYYGDREYI